MLTYPMDAEKRIIDRESERSPVDAAAHLPLGFGVAQAVAPIPRDFVPDMPDRIIAATAVHLELPLVTRDSEIRSTALDVIW